MSVSPFSHSANHTPSPHRKALETPLFQFKTFPSRRQSQVSILLLLDSGVPWELFRTPNSQLQGKSVNDSMETLNILKVPGTETHEIGNHSCLPSLELKSLSGETLEVINGSDAIENYLEQELRFSKNQIEVSLESGNEKTFRYADRALTDALRSCFSSLVDHFGKGND